jgi:hypothetical protein
MASGKNLLSDTKTRKQLQPEKGKGKIPQPAAGSDVMNGDPHQVFVKRTIKEKSKKSEVVEKMQKFCDAADALL